MSIANDFFIVLYLHKKKNLNNAIFWTFFCVLVEEYFYFSLNFFFWLFILRRNIFNRTINSSKVCWKKLFCWWMKLPIESQRLKKWQIFKILIKKIKKEVSLAVIIYFSLLWRDKNIFTHLTFSYSLPWKRKFFNINLFTTYRQLLSKIEFFLFAQFIFHLN
jgi:hypothetical protein